MSVNVGGSGSISPREARRRLGIPFSEVRGVFSLPITQANTFVVGQLVTAGATWATATMTSRTNQADGLVVRAKPARFWVATLHGLPIEILAHGLGSAGSTLWLGSSGAMTTTKPTGSTMKIQQRTGRILSSNWILLMIEHPEIF